MPARRNAMQDASRGMKEPPARRGLPSFTGSPAITRRRSTYYAHLNLFAGRAALDYGYAICFTKNTLLPL